MAITIDATVGGASANSYITLADANSIIEGLVADDDVAAWDGSNTDNKNRALFTAAIRVDRERFLGARVTNTQALQWPRQGVRKPDTYINTYSIGFPFRISTDYFAETEIPEQVKKAQVILAVYLNNNRNGRLVLIEYHHYLNGILLVYELVVQAMSQSKGVNNELLPSRQNY